MIQEAWAQRSLKRMITIFNVLKHALGKFTNDPKTEVKTYVKSLLEKMNSFEYVAYMHLYFDFFDILA